MTKFCPKCGEENEDVAQFCGNCGHDFKDVDKRMKESKRKDSSLNLPGTKILNYSNYCHYNYCSFCVQWWK